MRRKISLVAFGVSLFVLFVGIGITYNEIKINNQGVISAAEILKMRTAKAGDRAIVYLYTVKILQESTYDYELELNSRLYEIGDTIRVKYIRGGDIEDILLEDNPYWSDKWWTFFTFIILFSFAVWMWNVSVERLHKIKEGYIKVLRTLGLDNPQ